MSTKKDETKSTPDDDTGEETGSKESKSAAKPPGPHDARKPEQYGGLNLKDIDPKTAEAHQRSATAAKESSEKGAPGDGVQIVIRNRKFVPDNIQVKRGDTVRFVNKDTVPHSVIFTGSPTQTMGAVGSNIGASLIDLTMLGVGGQSSLPPVHGGGSMGGTSAGGGAPWTEIGNETKDASGKRVDRRPTSAAQGVPATGGPCTPVGVTERQYAANQSGGAEIKPNGTFEKVFDAAGTYSFRNEDDNGETSGTVIVS